MSSTKQRKRRRRRRLVLFLALGGLGYAARRRVHGGQPARSDLDSPASYAPRPPARATSPVPRPAAEKLAAEPAASRPASPAEPVARPAAEPAESPADAAEPVDSGAGPYGPDSHAALGNGTQPEGFPVKGNAGSMLYHVPGSAFYNRTVAEVWFRSTEAAEAAGFQLPPSQRDKPADQPVAETIPGTEALAPEPAKKAPAKKAAAKKAPAKTVAAKKAPAKKAVAKKASPKKTTPPAADE